MKRNIIITGGAGFIGSHVVRLFVTRYPEYRIINVDKLTYAADLTALADIAEAPNYAFEQADVADYERLTKIFRRYQADGVIHLAAESHVDRSIREPFAFARSNVLGTLSLLQAAKEAWKGNMEGKRFHHISTDEVFGALVPDSPPFTEQSPYAPHSPYSASKAAGDHFVRAFRDTYGLPVVISHCSNNYGPAQHPEKLIPHMIDAIRRKAPLPVYGKGENVRDWLYVEDHARAIDAVFHCGRIGESYAVGGGNEWRNIDLVQLLIRLTDRQLGRPVGSSDKLITYVADRPGHDLRYAIDSTKLRQETGWSPQCSFQDGLEKTVAWYLNRAAKAAES